MKLLRILAILAAVNTVAVAMMGAYVATSGAGLACPDWPLCHGQIIPPLDAMVLLEYTHRLLALSVVVLNGALIVVAWKQQRPEFRLAVMAAVLLIAQAGLGGLTVLFSLPPIVVAAHQGFAMLFFAAVVAFSLRVFQAPEVGTR